MESDPRRQREQGEEQGRREAPAPGYLIKVNAAEWDPSCAGTSEMCGEDPRIVLVKEGGRSIYSQLPALLDGELPGVGARHQGLPTLPFRGLSWLLQLQLVCELKRQAAGTCLGVLSQEEAPHCSWIEIKGEMRGHDVGPKT